MAKYSLGTDDIAGLHLMCLNMAKDILGTGGQVTVQQIIDGAHLIEAYIIDQATKDQIAAEAAISRVEAGKASVG